MATVTIAATYGAGGSVIGPEVARRLGLHFIDRAVPAALALKLPAMRDAGAELPPDELHASVIGRLFARTALTGTIFGYALPGDPDPGGDVAHGESLLRKAADAEGR